MHVFSYHSSHAAMLCGRTCSNISSSHRSNESYKLHLKLGDLLHLWPTSNTVVYSLSAKKWSSLNVHDADDLSCCYTLDIWQKISPILFVQQTLSVTNLYLVFLCPSFPWQITAGMKCCIQMLQLFSSFLLFWEESILISV